jgi:hypothetical protein
MVGLAQTVLNAAKLKISNEVAAARGKTVRMMTIRKASSY